ncbi:MAG TPA: TonB-dependent receptor plug domain-containing protein [Verrucomicrobiae bacterium]|jgi:vitamin B12 transporter|nr:TonB-dependent receptor plug domain-containing protein [Verrucomicrobiae bacterium]
MKLFYRASFALVFALAVVSALAAESGSIRGSVTDPLGAAVPNATVKLLQQGRQTAVTTSGKDGTYKFSALAVGRYQVSAEAATFTMQSSPPVYVGGGESEVNIALALGSVEQQVVVTDTGTQIPETQVGASVTVITSDQFQNKLDVFEPLRQVPGAQIVQTGQRGGATSLFVRGGNSTANKVLVDGIPLNDIGGVVNFGLLATSGVEQVEVLRGPNSVLYGSDAMAGVVSLTTRRGTTPLPELSYEFDGGNFNSLRHDASLGGAFHRLDYFGEFSRFDTGNSEPSSEFHNASYLGNAGFAINSSTDLRVTARRTTSAIGLPNAIDFFGIPDDQFQKDQDAYIGVTLQNQTTPHWHNLARYGATRLRLLLENPAPAGIPDGFGDFFGNVVTIRGANGFSATGQAILNFAGGTFPSLFNSSTARDFGYFQSDYSFNSHLTALFGFRMENERGYTLSSFAKNLADRTNYSYIGEVHGSLGSRVYATLGGSVENNAVFGVAVTPRVSLAYYLFRPNSDGPWNGTKLKFNYGQGIKEPSIFDATSSLFGLLSQVPNGPQLISQFHVRPVNAERSRSFDFGVEQLFWNGKGKLAETFFHNRFTNQIEFVDPSAFPQLGVPPSVQALAPFGASINSADTRALGAETELEFNFGRGFRARGAYTYLDAVVERSFTSDNLVIPVMNPNIPNVPIGAFSPLKGGRPFRRAPHTGSFTLDYSRSRLALSFSGYLVSRRDDSTFLTDSFFGNTLLLPNRNLAPGYQKLDFGGSYRLNRHLALYTSVENLASQHYDAAFGFPALPLTLRSGLKVTLGGESWKWR